MISNEPYLDNWETGLSTDWLKRPAFSCASKAGRIAPAKHTKMKVTIYENILIYIVLN